MTRRFTIFLLSFLPTILGFSVEEDPKCEKSQEAQFACNTEYLSRLESLCGAVVEDLSIFNERSGADHRLILSKERWLSQRTPLCGAAHEWDADTPERSLTQIACYTDYTEKHYIALDEYIMKVRGH